MTTMDAADVQMKQRTLTRNKGTIAMAATGHSLIMNDRIRTRLRLMHMLDEGPVDWDELDERLAVAVNELINRGQAEVERTPEGYMVKRRSLRE